MISDPIKNIWCTRSACHQRFRKFSFQTYGISKANCILQVQKILFSGTHFNLYSFNGICIYCLLLSSGLLSKNLKIKIYKTIILSVVLYGCETWSLIKGGIQAEGI